jgi:hypothetical protein
MWMLAKILMYKTVSSAVVGLDSVEKGLNGANYVMAQLEGEAKSSHDQGLINSKASNIRAYQAMQEEFEDLGNADIDAMIQKQLKAEAKAMVTGAEETA